MSSLCRRAHTTADGRHQAFRGMLLFGMQFLTYDEGGNLVITIPTNGSEDVPDIDTSFSQSTVGGTTRLCALSACSLMPHDLDAILALASASTFDILQGVTDLDDIFSSDDG